MNENKNDIKNSFSSGLLETLWSISSVGRACGCYMTLILSYMLKPQSRGFDPHIDRSTLFLICFPKQKERCGV